MLKRQCQALKSNNLQIVTILLKNKLCLLKHSKLDDKFAYITMNKIINHVIYLTGCK